MTITVSEDMTTDGAQSGGCSVCGAKIAARGWCMKHYKRYQRTGSTDSTRTVNKGKPCSVEGCGNGAHSLGLCEMHYARQRKDGDVGQAAPKIGLSLHERAMRMVDTSAGPDACHPWTSTVIGVMPAIFIGPRDDRTSRSARRVIAHHEGLLDDVDDQSQWIRMRDTCDPLCCNTRHMDVTNATRANTRKDA
jgi:hypothetical protein